MGAEHMLRRTRNQSIRYLSEARWWIRARGKWLDRIAGVIVSLNLCGRRLTKPDSGILR
jgi:hypothetical protein